MTGLLTLILIASLLLVVVLTTMLVRGARNPKRHAAGYALARGRPCDPDDLGIPTEEWWLHRPGGVRLPVWTIDGTGSGPTAVIVHGWGQGRVDYLLDLDLWRTRCRRVVLYDLRGHGSATGGPSNLGAGEEYDLVGLLDTLDTEPALLIGYSMGAVIALHAASTAPHLVAAIVAHGLYDDFHTSLKGRLAVEELPARPLTDLAMAIFRSCGLRHQPVSEIAARVTCPVLVVHGEADPVSPLEHGRRLAAALTGATLYEIPNGGHLDARRLDQAGYDRTIDTFLSEIPDLSPAAGN